MAPRAFRDATHAPTHLAREPGRPTIASHTRGRPVAKVQGYTSLIDDRRKSDIAPGPDKSRNASTADAMEEERWPRARAPDSEPGRYSERGACPVRPQGLAVDARPRRLASVRDRPATSVRGRTRDARARYTAVSCCVVPLAVLAEDRTPASSTPARAGARRTCGSSSSGTTGRRDGPALVARSASSESRQPLDVAPHRCLRRPLASDTTYHTSHSSSRAAS
jgi:hypothetical protein